MIASAIRLLRCVIAASTILIGVSAHAQPANDLFENAEEILSVPFSDSESLIETATGSPDDPYVLCRGDSFSGLIRGGNSVWYRYTPSADAYVNISTDGSTYDTMVQVLTGESPATLQVAPGGCSDDATTSRSLIAGFHMLAGTTYYIEVTRYTASSADVSLLFSILPAPQYHVTKTTDSADGTCGGDCSLREAIGAANASPGAVIVPAGAYTITLAGSGEDLNATGDIDIRSSMSIYGTGPFGLAGDTTITVQTTDRALHLVTNSSSVLVQNLRIRGGASPTTGGAIATTPQLGWLALDRVHLMNNDAATTGGAVHVSGGLRVTSSSLFNNEAGGSGGAINIAIGRYDEIDASSIYGNFASGESGTEGGGGVSTVGVTRITNSTIYGNRTNGAGGGLNAVGTAAVYTISSSAIIGNRADFDGDAAGDTGGGLSVTGAVAQATALRNSVLAGNLSHSPGTPDDCARNPAATAIAPFYVLMQAVSPTCGLGGTGNINNGTAPNYDTLDQSGITAFLPPLSPSATIDTGDPAGCTDGQNRALTLDQRGGPRQLGTRCDMGPVEFGAVGPDALFANGFE